MLKTVASRYLPPALERRMRAWRYHRRVRTVSIDAEPELLGCKLLVQPGTVAIDVGANIGVYTKFLSDFVGPSGRVCSLEPIAETFSYLQSNVAELNLPNVECYMTAASERDGTGRMFVPEYAEGGRNLYRAAISDDGGVAVRLATLDSLFLDRAPQFIKCDVEGHEFACILGASQIIRRYRPCWLVEVTGSETFRLMESLGYDTWWFDGTSFRTYDPAIRRTNYFFLPRS
jgi:FkbM family methyltransferase